MKNTGQLNLKPENVFYYFEQLAAIPHGSRNTKQISDYLVSFAKEQGLEYYQDEANNVVMIAEATKGYENAEPIIIQGHMDMVCEKENGYDIDFEKDGLKLYVDGDFLKAEGTTLGGDDGIAVAYALAILADEEIAHPRLEVVITVDEEIGMLGAESIDLSMLKGHKMLNIDSDVEGHFLTSCAGGMTVETKIPVSYDEQNGLVLKLVLTGLEGGHSGSEIDKEHANANIEMGRLLKYLLGQNEFGIVSLAGGLKDNAIPRECTATILVAPEQKETILSDIRTMEQILKKEYEVSDPNVRIDVTEEGEKEASCLNVISMTKILFYLRNVPNGVIHMSKVMPGLVETSLNAGIMNLTGEAFEMVSSVRSSVSSRKEELGDRLEYLAEFLGGEIEINGSYPAWEYRSDSEIRKGISAVYEDLFGEEPVFEAIHAGLECGILSGKIDNLDCVSFGPNNYDIHTPKERLSISSTQKVWDVLVEFLKRCK